LLKIKIKKKKKRTRKIVQELTDLLGNYEEAFEKVQNSIDDATEYQEVLARKILVGAVSLILNFCFLWLNSLMEFNEE